MSLAHKLYKIGKLVSKEEIRAMIESTPDDIGSYITLQIDFKIENDILIPPEKLEKSSLDNLKTMFTKKIGGTSNSYYLYPNFEYQKENNLYKKFKATAYTFENSVVIYTNEENQKLAKSIFDYIKAYEEDTLNLKVLEKGNYFLIFTINGKSIYELMPEIWDNYFNDFVDAHIYKKVKGVNIPQLTEQIDFVTHQKELCGYNPNVKFFTMDNYNDSFKPQIIDKLPMSKDTAIAIKKGWMYAITHLKFYHKGLEYIIIPSMVNFDEEVYKKLLKFLQQSNSIQNLASKEDSFVRRLSKQIEGFEKNTISLDILFTEVNLTNLSVKIFATLEDVIPSRINEVVKKMQKYNISDSNFIDSSKKDIVYLKNYFANIELLANATKIKGLNSRIKQERVTLAKLLLGYKKIKYTSLLNAFEKSREVKYNFKDNKVEKNLVESSHDTGIKISAWLEYPNRYIEAENKVLLFLDDLNSISYQGDK